ncbi:DUF6086 family protein [Streptomyces sp. NBC_00344]|uniref:DUF6086 family protein n=1 Tax=Streptomyces sp. NBC_00344 TaxID=2975720 RepID=UPI003FA689DA
MSYYFEVDGRTVWDCSLRIGRWFIASAESVAGLIDLPTGLAPSSQDSCDIELKIFRGFVDGLRECYNSTRHPVMHSLMDGLLVTCLVLLERGGTGSVPMNLTENALFERKAIIAQSM